MEDKIYVLLAYILSIALQKITEDKFYLAKMIPAIVLLTILAIDFVKIVWKALNKQAIKQRDKKVNPATEQDTKKEDPADVQRAKKEKPATKKGAKKEDPATKQRAKKEKPATEQGAKKEDTAAEQRAKEEKPATEQDAKKEDPAIVQRAKKEKPATKKGAKKEDTATEQRAKNEKPATEQGAKNEEPANKERVKKEEPMIKQNAQSEAPTIGQITQQDAQALVDKKQKRKHREKKNKAYNHAATDTYYRVTPHVTQLQTCIVTLSHVIPMEPTSREQANCTNMFRITAEICHADTTDVVAM